MQESHTLISNTVEAKLKKSPACPLHPFAGHVVLTKLKHELLGMTINITWSVKALVNINCQPKVRHSVRH